MFASITTSGFLINRQASPCDAKANGTHVGQDIIDEVLFPSPDLEINVDLGEFQLYVIDVVKKEDENANVVVSEDDMFKNTNSDKWFMNCGF